jgi:uncharacterized protein
VADAADAHPLRQGEPVESATLDPVKTARRGFMVVVQDTRGRFTSDGDWTPFGPERLDGYDSVEWAARLPGSNGRVGCTAAATAAAPSGWRRSSSRPRSRQSPRGSRGRSPSTGCCAGRHELVTVPSLSLGGVERALQEDVVPPGSDSIANVPMSGAYRFSSSFA